MIDPDGLNITTTALQDTIHIKEVPELDMEVYSLEDDKEFDKFMKDIEGQVRRSFEYRQFISYIRDNMNMNQCSFLQNVSNTDTYAIKIEIHHYPFTLRDISEIVYRKRKYYGESLNLQMIAKEVMELHYKLMIGLIPLSETVHELAHSGKIFVPADKVMGRYDLFVYYYKPFIEPQQLETLSRIERYTVEQHGDLQNTTILNENKVHYDVKDSSYLLPEFSTITNNMIEQIKTIKENNYILPNVQEVKMIEDHMSNQTYKPVTFDPAIKAQYTTKKLSLE